MVVRAIALVLLASCGRVGFDPLREAATDASIDGPRDGAPDSSIVDAPDGPIDSAMAACASDPNYQTIAGGGTVRYKTVLTLTSWPAAVANCEADGAHLAIPDTMTESVAIGNRADWIGVTDAATEDTWLTIFGTPAPFLQFQAGQPDGGTAEDCLRVDSTGTFEDRDCNDPRDFVCECPP